ncbi:integrase, catalytic region, zinc finger, CCHC-type containing protein [Tanacetum coccineum]
MSSNSNDIPAAGSDTYPLMLDRTNYESWSQRIRLYCRGKENGLQILQSIGQGPFELGTTRSTLGTTLEGGVLLGPERPHTYDDLSDTEKKRYDTDVRATNTVLQGLPKDIYKLINHNIEAKSIWDNVKMLLAGSELTKEDRESQLYDEFERFKMLLGENINEYYVRFHKLVNDIRNIRMTMPNIQLNSKFVNNMSLEWDRFVTAIKLNKDGRVVVQNVQGRQNQRYLTRGNGAAGNEGTQNRAGNANAGQGKTIKCYNCNRIGHIARNYTQLKRPQNSNYFKDKMLLMQAQENGAVLDEEELLFLAGIQANTFDVDVDNQPVQDLALNEDKLFQADECEALDLDVDDKPTAQSIFMANLSSPRPANLQASPSNASILSEENVIDSTTEDMGNSNVIPYEQYLSVNNVSGVPSCASSVLSDAYVLSDNDANVPREPIATELKIYKEQVAIYEQRAKFELTEREHKMDDQMHMLIQNRNKTKENLKKELHSVKLQLNSTMENNKIIKETVTTLKQEFKQKETKFLTDFSNLKNIKDKLENKLHAQGQSIKTVHMMLNPTKVYDQKTKTTIGAENPFYLRQAKKAQPSLYDGEELLKTHHVPVTVSSSEEDQELEIASLVLVVYGKGNGLGFWAYGYGLGSGYKRICVFYTYQLAEITRIKMHEKMNDSACVEKRVKITPPNYIKENFMATYTPQTQLTPEQVFWSLDLEKQKAKELKANAPPLPVLPPATVYTPNTPVHLVPRTLPTISQVNIGITEGERGFEQTKRCYLTEVITFFNLIKEHFDGVQKSLVTEVRAMKAVFEDMKAEVDQNVIDKKCGEIERNNLLITNENLIANCIAQDVFYTVTDSALTASRFHDLFTAYNAAMIRAVELESENSRLLGKIKYDDHDTMIKDFSKLEDVPEFDAFFELGMRDDQIQSHKNTIRKLKAQISELNANKSDDNRHLDYKSLDSQNSYLKETVTTLQNQLENFQAENAKIKLHYQELFDSIKVTRVKTTAKATSLQTEIENLKTQLKGKMSCVTSDDKTPKVFAFENLRDTLDTLREIVEEARSELPSDSNLDYSCVYTKRCQELLANASASCPIVVNKRDKFIATTPVTMKKRVTFADPLETSGNNTPKHVKQQSVQPTNTPTVLSTGVVQIVLWYLDSGCSKHMTGDHSRLRNFMKKFIKTVRFGNDHFGAIIGYGDYVIGDSVISRKAHVFRHLDSVNLIKGNHGTNLYTISVEDMMRSSPICLLSKASKNKSWLWHRCLNHLNFGTLNDIARKDLVRGLSRLKFEKDHLCSTCQLGKSKKATHKPKTINTIMEVLHTLHMDLCGPLRVQSINGKKYILVIVDDYSRFTWVKFLRSKDETPAFVINLLKQLQVGLNKIVRFIVLRTPQQNGVVERWNHTLVVAARTMLIFSKIPLFLWAKAVATACYTQN